MPLLSKMFRNDARLQSCLTNDASHLVLGTVGQHVGLIQTALFVVEGLRVAQEEERSQRYGTSTAAAVLDFKTKRGIINTTYQSQPDNIVGKMTISALDRELLQRESRRATVEPGFCGHDPRFSGFATRPGNRTATFTFASFRSNLGSVGAGARLAGTGSRLSPATVAKQRSPGGITAVSRAQAKLATLVRDRARPTVPTSPVVLDVADALWRNFGLPVFPKNSPLLPDQTNGAVKNLDDYLAVVAAVLNGMAQNLGQASLLFRDIPAPQYPNAHAFTLSLDRRASDPADKSLFPDGIYFNPRYLADGTTPVGPIKQTEVAIHECAHMVQNNNIADEVALESLSSAYGYSNFVLHCAFGRETIADTE